MSLPVETERKFLVTGTGWRGQGPSCRIAQGYFTTPEGVTMRVRQQGEQGWLAVKVKKTGCSRFEFEYPIPLDHARFLMSDVCREPPVEKVRHQVREGSALWVVDEFLGRNEGLVVAEIELDAPAQLFALPNWVGAEVTGDRRFANSALYREPYGEWLPTLPLSVAAG